MSRLFVLCFAILSLICAIQCTPTSLKRGEPSHRPGGLTVRGLCYFYCPQENVVGEELSGSSADPGRLYCRYNVEGADDKEFCMYNRVSLSCKFFCSFVMLIARSDPHLEHR